MIQNIETYKDLKAFLNTLSDKQLSQKAQVWGEQSPARNIIVVDMLDEDYVGFDECYEPISIREEEIGTSITQEEHDELVSDAPRLKKGTIILMQD